MSLQNPISHMQNVSRVLIEAGREIDWLKEKSRLSLFKKGLQGWLKQLRKYLRRNDLTLTERSAISGEEKRVQYELESVSTRLREM
ncbi:MAG: hypothetical protein KAR24_02025 [Candidatus Pacebacteria bacterium]|nr:hypothetical protein [Candidatus Paceibacterota bacterium]